MRPKALKDLSVAPDDQLFAEIARGLDLVIQNAESLWFDANALWEQDRRHGYRILIAFAEEEAAKFLILLDSARCPRKPSNLLPRQLGRFYDHLAKGIYAAACDWRVATFGELVSYVEGERKERYLDGPSDVDWIFPNQILSQREEAIYVDFVELEERSEWVSPKHGNQLAIKFTQPRAPSPLSIAFALRNLGCTTAEALRVIASEWRSVEITEEVHWQQLRKRNLATLEALDANGLLREGPPGSYAVNRVVDEWIFPLHSLDLSKILVKESELREEQRRWASTW